MSLRIGELAPDFEAATTEGTIRFHEWVGDGWAVLFSHPKDFTPVCSTELGYLASLKPEFDKRGCRLLGLSVDAVSDHERWAADIQAITGHKLNFPLVGDPELAIARLYGMLPADVEGNAAGARPATTRPSATCSSSGRAERFA